MCVVHSVERHCVCSAQSREALCVCTAQCRGTVCVVHSLERHSPKHAGAILNILNIL